MQVTPPKTRSQINLSHLVINRGVKTITLNSFGCGRLSKKDGA